VATNGGSFLIAQEGSNKVLRQFVINQAGVNAWVADTEPITLLGGSLTNLDIQVDVLIGSGSAQINIAQLTCGSADTIDQSWVFQNTDNTIRLKGDLTSCMEVMPVSGLDANVYLNDCYDKFLQNDERKMTPSTQNWTYNSAKQIVSAFNGQCLDVVGVSTSDGANIDTWTCVNQANEKFDYDSNKGYLTAEHSQKCVTAYRNSAYAGICGRIQPGKDWERAGYCLYLFANGDWRFFAATKVIGTGHVDNVNNNWHNLIISLNGTTVKAAIDKNYIVNVQDQSYSNGGFVTLNSGWNIASFDNFVLAN